jgi:hypothetical protein
VLAGGAGALAGGASAIAAITLARPQATARPTAPTRERERRRRQPASDHPCSHEEDRNDMHGHERPVERKIRLWVAQLEEDRRKARQPGRSEESGDAFGERHQHVIDARAHEQSQGR